METHGPAPQYQCQSFKNPSQPFYGSLKAIPRSYSLNSYNPEARRPLQHRGVSGPGHARRLAEIHSTTDAIVMTENNGGNMLGRWTPALDYPPGFRNRNNTGWATVKAAHADGRLSNFLMADGHVEALNFLTTATKADGTAYFAGADFTTTMWDAAK